MGAYVIELGEHQSDHGRCEEGHASNSSTSNCSTGHPTERCVIEYEHRRDPSDTCCWKIPLRLAILIIAVVEVVGVVVNLILAIVGYFRSLPIVDSDGESIGEIFFDYSTRRRLLVLICSSIGAAVTFLVVGLLAVGSIRRKPCLLVPHMIVQMCAIVALLVPSVLVGIDAARSSLKANNGESNTKYKRRLVYDILVLEVLLIAIALCVYFLVIVRRRFRNLRRGEADSKGIEEVAKKNKNDSRSAGNPTIENVGVSNGH